MARFLATGAAAALVGMPIPAAAAPPMERGYRMPMDAIVPSPASAARIAAWLQQHCGGGPAVERMFGSELAFVQRLAGSSATSGRLAAELQQAIRGDFAAGRVHVLDGWMLARTELALCYHVAAAPQRGADIIS